MFVGHTAYAQIVVLAIFLGGMSVGALLISSRSERLKDPLVWYARVELLIGLIGFVFHPIFNFVTHSAYDTLFPALGNATTVLAARWILSAALILPQSILLGTTFPLMSAAVLRRFRNQPGGSLAILYFANSFGAAAGVLLAGFFLIAFVGLPGTLFIASVINILVALAAFLVSYSDFHAAKRGDGYDTAYRLSEYGCSSSVSAQPQSPPSPHGEYCRRDSSCLIYLRNWLDSDAVAGLWSATLL